MNFAKRAEELSDQIIKDRRYLHQHPELSYKEKNTTAYLVASLKELGSRYRHLRITLAVLLLLKAVSLENIPYY